MKLRFGLVFILATAWANISTSQTVRAKLINNVRMCDLFSGTDFSDKIGTCYSDLPATGGVMDARGLTGSGQTIAATIDMSGVGSKPVHLMLGAGTFTFTSTSGVAMIMSDDSIIEGQGQGVTILKIADDGASGIQPGARSVIRNMTITGNTNFLMAGCGCGIYGNVDGVTLENVEVDHWGAHGVNTSGGSNWKVLHSHIHHNFDDGIFVANAGSSRGNLIQGNRSELNGSNGIDNNALDTIIDDNDVVGNGAEYSMTGVDCYGILTTSIGGNDDGTIIHGNRVKDNLCQQVIIRADGSGTTNKIAVSTNIISSTVSAGSAGIGINLDTSVGMTCGTTSHISISGNIVYGNSAQGILVGGGSGTPCVVSAILITGNIVTGAGDRGIWAVYGSGVRIVNNIATGNNMGGTQIENASTDPVTFCNLIDTSTSLCSLPDGVLALNTLQPDSGVETNLTSSGNTEFSISSSAGGSRKYGLVVDNSGNGFWYDLTSTTPIIKTNSSHQSYFPEGLGVGTGGLSNQIHYVLVGGGTLTYGATAAGTSQDQTLTVTGVTDIDTCAVGVQASKYAANDSWTCFVSGTNTVTVRHNNYSANPETPGSVTVKIQVTNF